MKKLTLTTFLSLLFVVSFANRPIKNLGEIKDYRKAEPKVLECAEYLLKYPVYNDEEYREIVLNYMLSWMVKNPTYKFVISEEEMKLVGKNSPLLPVYLAALTRATLENICMVLTNEEIKKRAENYFLDYCGNPYNGTENNKEIKKRLRLRKAVLTTT